MIIRVRTKVGTWRVEGLEPGTTIAAVRARIQREHNVNPHPSQVFSLDAQGHRPAHDKDTIGGLGLKHGDILFFAIREEDCAGEHGKKIAADGTIVNKTHEEVASQSGFRPGMMSLRSMKMHWTLADFVELDSQFEHKIKAQKEPWCSKVSMDKASSDNFQSYMRRVDMHQCRMGFLYGRVDEKNEVTVEAMYEPPQDSSAERFTLLEDPRAERVEQLAAALKLQKVGWIFAHPPREKGFVFSGVEVITAAVEQLEAAQGVKETPFATVRCTFVEEEGAMLTHFDAFQVSKQCMEMVAEGAVGESDEPGSLAVNPTYTAIVEGKPARSVDNNFFLVNVPIANHESELFVSRFPRFNRADEMPEQGAMRAQLSMAGKSGWTFVDMLSDFHLLLFLTDFLDMNEVSVICESVVDRSRPLGEGHVDLLRAIAGIE